ncbi:Zn-dependent exopeptidases superfamily protein isoform X2 [Wolffia australiana]
MGYFHRLSLVLNRHFLLSLSLMASAWKGQFVLADSLQTPISRDLYRSSDALLHDAKDLVNRHPDLLMMETLKAGDSVYSAEVAVITYNRTLEGPKNSKFRLLLSFGQHGRELITSEVALKLLYAICGEIDVPGYDMVSLSRVLEDLTIKVVPMENINGRKLVESGELCERRNGRGVDLNRNWDVDWGKKEKDYDPYEENPGTGPFSEPEAQIMQKLAESFRPHVWVNVHSGMEGLFMPYDHKNSTPGGSQLLVMKSILDEINYRHCHHKCLIGSGGGSVGYLAHGTATDYMYDVLRIPISFTFEIYGDLDAPSKDCFRMFNPVDAATFVRVVNDWPGAFFFSVLDTARRRLPLPSGRKGWQTKWNRRRKCFRSVSILRSGRMTDDRKERNG